MSNEPTKIMKQLAAICTTKDALGENGSEMFRMILCDALSLVHNGGINIGIIAKVKPFMEMLRKSKGCGDVTKQYQAWQLDRLKTDAPPVEVLHDLYHIYKDVAETGVIKDPRDHKHDPVQILDEVVGLPKLIKAIEETMRETGYDLRSLKFRSSDGQHTFIAKIRTAEVVPVLGLRNPKSITITKTKTKRKRK